jgi:AraC-like DNA-binding protein
MTPQELANLAHLRRARDFIDREYARPLDVPTNYLMTRRIERAMALLRAGASVTDACMEVGCTSLGSFSTRFTEIVGINPSEYRAREHHAVKAMPSCIAKQHTRPERNGNSQQSMSAKNVSRIEEAPAS